MLLLYLPIDQNTEVLGSCSCELLALSVGMDAGLSFLGSVNISLLG